MAVFCSIDGTQGEHEPRRCPLLRTRLLSHHPSPFHPWHPFLPELALGVSMVVLNARALPTGQLRVGVEPMSS